MAQTLVHGHECSKAAGFGDEFQQAPVLDSRPARLRDGFHFVTGQIAGKARRQTLVEEDTHQAVAAIESSRCLPAFSMKATACLRVTVGKSSKNSSSESPASR